MAQAAIDLIFVFFKWHILGYNIYNKMKYLIKFYTIFIFLVFFTFNSYSSDKIKIGLVIPLSGENKELGESVLKSVRLAINDINDTRIQILPKDNQNDPYHTLKVSEESI